MIDDQLAVLAGRCPLAVPIDPSLTSFFVQEGHIQGSINVAMPTLVFYNAYYAVKNLVDKIALISNPYYSDDD